MLASRFRSTSLALSSIACTFCSTPTENISSPFETLEASFGPPIPGGRIGGICGGSSSVGERGGDIGWGNGAWNFVFCSIECRRGIDRVFLVISERVLIKGVGGSTLRNDCGSIKLDAL